MIDPDDVAIIVDDYMNKTTDKQFIEELKEEYKREKPDTICGEKITISQTYYSFDKDKIDKSEEECKNNIGAGLISEMKGE